MYIIQVVFNRLRPTLNSLSSISVRCREHGVFRKFGGRRSLVSTWGKHGASLEGTCYEAPSDLWIEN